MSQGTREGFHCPTCKEFYSTEAFEPPEFKPIFFHRYLTDVEHQQMILHCDFGDEHQTEIHAITVVEDFDEEHEIDFTQYYLFQTSLESHTTHGIFTPVQRISLTPRLLNALKAIEDIK